MSGMVFNIYLYTNSVFIKFERISRYSVLMCIR
jgi:hypothetical protein